LYLTKTTLEDSEAYLRNLGQLATHRCSNSRNWRAAVNGVWYPGDILDPTGLLAVVAVVKLKLLLPRMLLRLGEGG